MRNLLLELARDFIGLMYPSLCLACQSKHPPKEQLICVSCQVKLPKTNFHLEEENYFTERFWGRVLLESAAALYFFHKGSPVQKILHSLKYEGKHEIGFQLGQKYGKQLKQSPYFRTVDIIVPVPLHPKKQLQRGYNQSDTFANGLSETMRIPWLANGLKRTKYGDSQTRMSREERLLNVMEAFEVDAKNKLAGKHILLVDDVLTTGATLETCADKLLALPNTKVSMATIALAKLN